MKRSYRFVIAAALLALPAVGSAHGYYYDGGRAIVGHHAEAFGEVFELAGWRRFGDVV